MDKNFFSTLIEKCSRLWVLKSMIVKLDDKELSMPLLNGLTDSYEHFFWAWTHWKMIVMESHATLLNVPFSTFTGEDAIGIE